VEQVAICEFPPLGEPRFTVESPSLGWPSVLHAPVRVCVPQGHSPEQYTLDWLVNQVDVVIAPVMDLTLPLVGAIIRGNQVALELAQQLRPQVMLSTAMGDYEASGFLLQLVQAKGDIATFQQQLAQAGLPTRAMELPPQQAVTLPLETGLRC